MRPRSLIKTVYRLPVAIALFIAFGCTSYLSLLSIDKKDVAADLGQGYSIDIVRGTFILATNLNADNKAIARQVIETGMDALYTEYFINKPTHPIKVYVFKDKKCYEDYVMKAYKKPPSTPFGFYIPRERKVVLDFSTGTGTLMHEITHPLISADFPLIPAWFNEGLASLFEQSVVVNGKLRGQINWRLKILMEHLNENNYVNFQDVFSQAESNFYGKNSSLNYAVARYLCMWLQENNLLKKYYIQFKEDVLSDQDGIKTLEKIVGKDINTLQKEWVKWVKTLN